MFRIVCGPSSGSIELYLTEIIRSGWSVFDSVILNQWGVFPARRTVHTHHCFKITLPNTDQAHDKHL
jgi:hypothetical protein